MKRTHMIGVGLAVGLVAIVSCSVDSPTGTPGGEGSLVLGIATNLDASQFDAVRVAVKDFSPPASYDPRSSEDIAVPSEASLPMAKPVRAISAEQRRVLIDVAALKAGAVVVSRTLRTRIPLDRSQMVAVVLEQACASPPFAGCLDGSTCVGGSCVADDVALDGLPDYKPGAEHDVSVPPAVHDAGAPATDGGSTTTDAGGTKDGTATVGSPCGLDEERACAGFAQRIALQCIGGKWAKTVECGTSTNCDTREGATRGTCQKILDECANKTPGTKICNTDSTGILTCGPDLVTADSVACDVNGSCANATCACNPGYDGDGLTCASRCGAANGGCSPLATCELVPTAPNGRTCTCNPGYAGDGIACEDVDECKTNNGGCSPNATCTNTVGSRTCKCNSGYEGDGGACADVNECAMNNGGCSPNATCTNTPGGRTCTCKSGYSGDGVTCNDVNECATNNGGCSANAKCTNTPGSRTCACNAGYTGSGTICSPLCGRFLGPVDGWVKDTTGAGLSWTSTPLAEDTWANATYTVCAARGGRLPTSSELLNLADGTPVQGQPQINTCAFSGWPVSNSSNGFNGGALWVSDRVDGSCSGGGGGCSVTQCVDFTNNARVNTCNEAFAGYPVVYWLRRFVCVRP